MPLLALALKCSSGSHSLSPIRAKNKQMSVVTYTHSKRKKSQIVFQSPIFFFLNLFIWLCQVLVATHIFDLHCSMQEL